MSTSTRLRTYAAGSHETVNDMWRGGVVLGSLGEANKRMEGRIGDCRGWGRYIGRVYRGASKKTMIVVETYFPNATYEPEAMNGRAAAYDDTGRCACHLSPLGCTLVDCEKGVGDGLIDLYGHKPEGPSNGTPAVRAGSLNELTDPQPSPASAASGPSAEVRKRSANLMAWCERCAVGIHFYCANDHALEYSGDDHIGNYQAKGYRGEVGSLPRLLVDLQALRR